MCMHKHFPDVPLDRTFRRISDTDDLTDESMEAAFRFQGMAGEVCWDELLTPKLNATAAWCGTRGIQSPLFPHTQRLTHSSQATSP